MPPALAEWRVARARVSHTLIERTLLQLFCDLKAASGVKHAEIRDVIVEYWRETVKPFVKSFFEQAAKVLSPGILLLSIGSEERALSRFDAAAQSVPLGARGSLSARIAAANDAVLNVDAAIENLKKSFSPDVVEVAQEKVELLRTCIRELPNSPVIP